MSVPSRGRARRIAGDDVEPGSPSSWSAPGRPASRWPGRWPRRPPHLRRDFRAINSRQARVVLVDATGQVLPPFGAELGKKAKRLEKPVEVLLGAMVTNVDERGIEVQYKDGRVERIAAVTKIWAAGVQASSLTKTLSEQTGAPLDRGGRIRVNPDLTLPGYPEVFVVGDMIDLEHLPGVAQVAIQGAKFATKEIERRLAGKPQQKPFHYYDKGSMATISRFRAVAMIGKLRLTGFVAWLLWLVIHPPLPDPLQEPDHRPPALVGLVHRPRAVGTDLDRAADLRARGVATSRGRRDRPGLRTRGVRRGRGLDRAPSSAGGRSSRSRRWPRSGSPTRASAGSR